MSFNGSMARHWATTSGYSALSGLDSHFKSQSTANIDKPKLRSLSANRAQSVAQAGVIQMNSDPDGLMQLFLDNARMWDCLCLVKSDPTLQCETAIRIIFSLDDSHFLSPSADMDVYGLEHKAPKCITSAQSDSEDLDLEEQRLMIENSRLHAILWVLRDNPSLQIDSTVATVFRMDDAQIHDKFGVEIGYSPGCLSLLMKMGTKWKPRTATRSPSLDKSVSQILRYNRSRSASSKEMRSQIRRMSGVKQQWSAKTKKSNTTSNWKATVSEDREPTRKSMQGNTIWLMSERNDMKNSDSASSSNHRESTKIKVEDGASSAVHSTKNETIYNKSVNRQPQPQRSRHSCYSNNAESSPDAATCSPPIKNLPGYGRHVPPDHGLDDFYTQQQDALGQSLLDSKEDSRIPMPTSLTTWDERIEESARHTLVTPEITLSKTPARLPLRGKPYPLPEHPTPRYFIERHGQTKTDFEYPMKFDLKFCFNSKLHVPYLEASEIIGPIDASNKILKQCN